MTGDDYSINITDKQDDFPDPFADAVSEGKKDKDDGKKKTSDPQPNPAPPSITHDDAPSPHQGAPDLIPSQSGGAAKPAYPMPDIFLTPGMPGMTPHMPSMPHSTQTAYPMDNHATDKPDEPPAPIQEAAPMSPIPTQPKQDRPDPAYAGENKRNILAIGDRVNLNDLDPTLRQMSAGLGWQFKGYEGEPLDLDVSVFLLNKDDLTREDSDFIYYNNEQGCDGAVTHDGDNRIGAGDGDDENVRFDMPNIPFDVVTIMFVISIYQGEDKGQDFSSVNSAYLRLFNDETSREICRINISEANLTGGTALKIAALERMGPKWEFHALGEVVDGGLKRIAEEYGIVVGEY